MSHDCGRQSYEQELLPLLNQEPTVSWAIKALGSPCQQLTRDMLIILGKPKQEPGARKARSILKKSVAICWHCPFFPLGL